jgi:hypothetical protein
VAPRKSGGEVIVGQFFSSLSPQTKYKIDYSLVPIAIILIEISVFATQLSTDTYTVLSDLMWLRTLHTIIMVTISFIVSQAYIRLKRIELNYQTLAMTGIVVISLGDIIHAYLGGIFGVELVSAYRRIGILILQGCVWFPVFIIIAGRRREILESFNDYEERLIVATRARSRESIELKQVQADLQNRIQQELHSSCKTLKSAIMGILSSQRSPIQHNSAIRPLLVGEDLRKLSRRLDAFDSEQSKRKFLGKDLESLQILLQQFRILYTSSVRLVPLSYKTYVLVLAMLVSPPYINFYSPQEALLSFPLLLMVVVILSSLATKLQGSPRSNALLASSLIVFITGLLPLVINLVGQAIFHDPDTRFPILITAVALPLTYYISMEFLQVLRPTALRRFRNDELMASKVLQSKVQRFVIDDFSQNLSHQWAVFIHGKVLTQLSAISLKLEAAARVNDTHAYNETVQSFVTLMDNPDRDFEEKSSNLQEEVISRLNPWRGLLTINLYIEPELFAIQNSRVRDLGEVVEELISNSIRHGKAKKIDLQVLRSGENEVDIIAIDNASIPPASKGQRMGLGSRIFNLASDGRWTISQVGLSTEFRLRMTIE